MGAGYGKLVSRIVKKYKKNKNVLQSEIRKSEKKKIKDEGQSTLGEAELKHLMEGVHEWRSVCKRINNVAHLIGAELDEQGFPCSVSINPIFHPSTRQTYSSQVKFLFSRMQMDELSHFYKGEKRKSSRERGLCRDEICSMALMQADSLLFEERLLERKVAMTRCINDKSKVFEFSFKELTDEKIAAILEKFIKKVFDAA